MMVCAIWYHLYNFKKLRKTHGGVLQEMSIDINIEISEVDHYMWIFTL